MCTACELSLVRPRTLITNQGRRLTAPAICRCNIGRQGRTLKGRRQVCLSIGTVGVHADRGKAGHYLNSHLRQIVGVTQCCGDVESEMLAVLDGGVSQADAQRAALHKEMVASDLCFRFVFSSGGKQSWQRQALPCLLAVALGFKP